jgi:hypothetical protein
MSDEQNLLVGGLVAVGFNATGEFLLTISHSGRGVFSTKTWTRVARNHDLAYPEDGIGVGIGPVDGERIVVSESYWEAADTMTVLSPDGRFELRCQSEGIKVRRAIP